MSSALLDAPTFALCPAGERRPTLAERLTETLHAARTEDGADCPLCHGPMHLDAAVARCTSCGTTLT
jgi:hypothetical protein